VVQIFTVRGQILRRHPLEELYVLVVVETAHVVGAGAVRAINFHFVVEAVVQHQTVYDRQTVWLHRMCWTVVEIADVRVVKVKHTFVGHISGGWISEHCETHDLKKTTIDVGAGRTSRVVRSNKNRNV